MTECFNKFDTDSSGKISCKELVKVLLDIGLDAEKAEELAKVTARAGHMTCLPRNEWAYIMTIAFIT